MKRWKALTLATMTAVLTACCAKEASQPQTAKPDLSTPDSAWRELLAAMKSGDEARLTALSTKPKEGEGFWSLDRMFPPNGDRAKRLAQAERNWEKEEIRWEKHETHLI